MKSNFIGRLNTGEYFTFLDEKKIYKNFRESNWKSLLMSQNSSVTLLMLLYSNTSFLLPFYAIQKTRQYIQTVSWTLPVKTRTWNMPWKSWLLPKSRRNSLKIFPFTSSYINVPFFFFCLLFFFFFLIISLGTHIKYIYHTKITEMKILSGLLLS